MSNFRAVLRKGQKILCSHSKRYYQANEMVLDGKGGFIHRRFDTKLHDQNKQRSRYQSGPDWYMT